MTRRKKARKTLPRMVRSCFPTHLRRDLINRSAANLNNNHTLVELINNNPRDKTSDRIVFNIPSNRKEQHPHLKLETEAIDLIISNAKEADDEGRKRAGEPSTLIPIPFQSP